jgi:hypothetical protein
VVVPCPVARCQRQKQLYRSKRTHSKRCTTWVTCEWREFDLDVDRSLRAIRRRLGARAIPDVHIRQFARSLVGSEAYIHCTSDFDVSTFDICASIRLRDQSRVQDYSGISTMPHESAVRKRSLPEPLTYKHPAFPQSCVRQPFPFPFQQRTHQLECRISADTISRDREADGGL